MSEELGLAVRVENDANLGALAEIVWGAGRGCSELLYVKVASGVGAGLNVSTVSIGGGVSQQGQGIAGSFAVDVLIDHTHATIADGAQINQRLTPATPASMTVSFTALAWFTRARRLSPVSPKRVMWIVKARQQRPEFVQMFEVALSRRICCSRVESVSTKPRRPSASTVSPQSRPGIWRTNFDRVAKSPT